MGFQSYHNTESKEHNIRSNQASAQRTSKVEALSMNTTKAQYERLHMSNSMDSKTSNLETLKGNCSPGENQILNQNSVRRNTTIDKVVAHQVDKTDDRLKGSGKPVGTGE